MGARLIGLVDALPCGFCGCDARQAWAVAVEVDGEGGLAEALRERYRGHWMMLPVCAECKARVEQGEGAHGDG